MNEKLQNMSRPIHPFEEMFEHSMNFLANPYKIWSSGKLELKKLVLKLCFSERLVYDKETGLRTPEIAFPFKVLGGFLSGEINMAHPAGVEPATSTAGR